MTMKEIMVLKAINLWACLAGFTSLCRASLTVENGILESKALRPEFKVTIPMPMPLCTIVLDNKMFNIINVTTITVESTPKLKERNSCLNPQLFYTHR